MTAVRLHRLGGWDNTLFNYYLHQLRVVMAGSIRTTGSMPIHLYRTKRPSLRKWRVLEWALEINMGKKVTKLRVYNPKIRRLSSYDLRKMSSWVLLELRWKTSRTWLLKMYENFVVEKYCAIDCFCDVCSVRVESGLYKWVERYIHPEFHVCSHCMDFNVHIIIICGS